MRLHRSLGWVAVLALLAVPLHAGIRAMNLAELMEITSDAVHVQVVDKSVHPTEIDGVPAVYTKLSVVGQSIRRAEPVSFDVAFLGSHDPQDACAFSEMPELQDVRIGSEAILFVDEKADFLDGLPVVHNLANAFRVEQAFGTKVVIGKGEGMAVATNTKLTELTSKVRELHIQLEAAKAALEAEKAANDTSDDK